MKLFWSFWITANVFFWMVQCVNNSATEGNGFMVWLILSFVTGLLPYLLWRGL